MVIVNSIRVLYSFPLRLGKTGIGFTDVVCYDAIHVGENFSKSLFARSCG